MMRLSELTGRRVVDGKGHALGRVVEVRSPGRPETEPREEARTVGTLLYGRRGLLERLGWAEPDPDRVDWREVDVLGDGTLRVDAAAMRASKTRRAMERRREAEGRSSAEPARAAAPAKPAKKAAAKRARKQRKAPASESRKAQKGAPGSKERKEC